MEPDPGSILSHLARQIRTIRSSDDQWIERSGARAGCVVGLLLILFAASSMHGTSPVPADAALVAYDIAPEMEGDRLTAL